MSVIEANNIYSERLAGLETWLGEEMARWQIPGLGLGIIANGEVIYSGGFGLRDVANNRPVDVDTLFAIGSCSKAFTTFGMGLLVDEGKLAWDTPLREYLPDFRALDARMASQFDSAQSGTRKNVTAADQQTPQVSQSRIDNLTTDGQPEETKPKQHQSQAKGNIHRACEYTKSAPGTGTLSITSSNTFSALKSCSRAAGPRIRRCPRQAGTSALTSSGNTKSRP